MHRVQLRKPRTRSGRPEDAVLPPGLRDPDVVRAKALARADGARRRLAGQPGVRRSAR
jgi:hypothetical protein